MVNLKLNCHESFATFNVGLHFVNGEVCLLSAAMVIQKEIASLFVMFDTFLGQHGPGTFVTSALPHYGMVVHRVGCAELPVFRTEAFARGSTDLSDVGSTTVDYFRCSQLISLGTSS